MPSSESNATMVNNALLLAKASVIGHRSISGDSISAATSGEQVRFAHARSSRRHANPAVANTSFITPMSGETANVGGVTGFTLPAGKTVTIKYSATISTTPTASSVSTKGTISPGPGGNFSSFETNDPETVGSPPNDPTVTNIAMPDLTITKSHSGTFKQGDTGKTYTIAVTTESRQDEMPAMKSFAAGLEWKPYSFPISDFQTDGSDITGVAFVSGGTPGKFDLELDEVEIR